MEPQLRLELLEGTHTFPCSYAFKVIGKNENAFAERVVDAVRKALQQEFDLSYKAKETPNGKHVSITIEPQVGNAEQIVAVYEILQHLDGLIMLL